MRTVCENYRWKFSFANCSEIKSCWKNKENNSHLSFSSILKYKIYWRIQQRGKKSERRVEKESEFSSDFPFSKTFQLQCRRKMTQSNIKLFADRDAQLFAKFKTIRLRKVVRIFLSSLSLWKKKSLIREAE